MKSVIRRKLESCISFFLKMRFKKKHNHKDFYVSIISKRSPWVYVSYIEHPFYNCNNANALNKHQNQREALAQVEIFNELGYNVYVQNYLSSSDTPNLKFDIVFGHEPNFTKVAIANPEALKVHYVPGAFIEHRNNQIIGMTDSFNRTYQSHVPYRRLLVYENKQYSAQVAYDIADKILLIGSKFTVETFPVHLHEKITTIHQSTQCDVVNTNIQLGNPHDFFFMGSGGNLLKGVSLLIEFFCKHPEFNLHIVGPIEPDVHKAIEHLITSNIKLYGFVDVNSVQMLSIMNKCNFIIYPSGSEGCPGSVLNSMKNGLIPIVTRWSAFDEIDTYGYILNAWDVDSIGEGVSWAMSLPDEKILVLKQRCSDYVQATYNLERYRREFKDYFITLINNK